MFLAVAMADRPATPPPNFQPQRKAQTQITNTLKERSCVQVKGNLKGLGHAILGNFSTDRMVIELTKISK